MEDVQERCPVLLPAWCHHPCCRAVASLRPPGNDRSFFWASGAQMWCQDSHDGDNALILVPWVAPDPSAAVKEEDTAWTQPKGPEVLSASPSGRIHGRQPIPDKKNKEQCKLQTLIVKGVWQRQQGFPAFITTVTIIASRSPRKAGIPRCSALGRLAVGISGQEVTGGRNRGKRSRLSALGRGLEHQGDGEERPAQCAELGVGCWE